ncbi:hypothetical protein M0805_000873 [Coniferiporia weirii]|nr:hypothetical protein M0805_000873 [Coniferiporia weirii]
MSTAHISSTILDNLLNTNNSSSPQSGTPSRSTDSSAAGALSHKRPASPSPDEDTTSRKRMKEDRSGAGDELTGGDMPHAIDGHALAEDLAQELQCGCCSELVYKPVVVAPCEHFFCGSCCTLWIKNGGTNCPACRGASSNVTPSRALQSMVDVLLRAAPHRQRTERERMQADEIYPGLRAFRIPAPREPSPEPTIPANTDFMQPCPHCAPNNSFNWTCPQPISDPNTDTENAWHINDGTPPGHGFCGNCEVLLALQAPSTTRCDFCQVSFCGINVQGRCIALGIGMQNPHGMADVGDLIQSAEVYDCFDGNTVEVEFMIEYMTAHGLSPRHIYRQIAAHIQSQPDGFQPLIDQEIFMDMHAVSGGVDPDPNAPRRFICRPCATEVFLYGLRDWWIRERGRAVRDGSLARRRDCPQGRTCGNIHDVAHAREFNHIIGPSETNVIEALVPQLSGSTSSSASSSTATGLPLHSSIDLPSAFRVERGIPIEHSFPSVPTGALPGMSGSSVSLPPFSALQLPGTIPAHSIPLFMRMGNVDHGFNDTEEHIIINAAPHVEHQSPMHERSRDYDVDVNVEDNDEDQHAEPSSSQSQRAVEAHLAAAMLAGYESEPDSDIERALHDADSGKGMNDADEDAQSEACLVAAAMQAGAELPSVRRAASQSSLGSKMNVDVDVNIVGAEHAHVPFSSIHPVSVSGTPSPFGLLSPVPNLDLPEGSGSGTRAPHAAQMHFVQVE